MLEASHLLHTSVQKQDVGSRRMAPIGAGTAALENPARHRRLHAAIRTARPKQWIKNLLVVAAAGAAGALGDDDVPAG